VRVIIVGAGGHGQVVADALIVGAAHGSGSEPIGYVDDNAALAGAAFLGLPVLGGLDALTRMPHDAVIVAIGDNDIRRSVFDALERRGERFAVARHPSAIIARGVSIGRGTVVCAGTIVNTATGIGANVILNTGCSIDHHSQIADHVHIGPGVRAGGGATVNVGALVGIGATIMPGRAIGEGSIVGAGALVHDDVDDYTIVVGVPARRVDIRAPAAGRTT
jgi:acetyltransferase EpsM